MIYVISENQTLFVLCVIQLICDDTKYMYLDLFCKKMNSFNS